jgi:DNA polymerase-1
MAGAVSTLSLIAHADKITGKIERTCASLDYLPLSKQLTTIKCDLDLPYGIEDLKQQPMDKTELRNLLAELGFSSWLKSLDTSTVNNLGPDKVKSAPAAAALTDLVPIEEGDSANLPGTTGTQLYETILTEEHFNEWLERLDKADLFAFDTETTSLDYSKARIVGVSFAVTPGFAAYLPLAHDYTGAPDQLIGPKCWKNCGLCWKTRTSQARAKYEIRYGPG